MTSKQRDIVVDGNDAAALAIKQCNVDSVVAFPITPQTDIVEKLSEYKANGEVEFSFVPVESEHSAMSAVVGSSAAGARAFTATNSQGLLLMSEIVWIASSLRLPIVMATVNRTVSAPINIQSDHQDILSQRDSSWIQIFAEDPQEAYDSLIQAFKIAEDEDILLPVMTGFEGFELSHTMERVKVFEDEEVIHDFLGGARKIPKMKLRGEEVEFSLNPKNPEPVMMGQYSPQPPNNYFEIKRQQFEAMENAREKIKEVNEEFAEVSGRKYGNGLIETHRMDDAEVAVVFTGSVAGTARWVVNKMRDESDEKVGLIRIRTYRPFPDESLVEALEDVDVVGAFCRSHDTGGIGGALGIDLQSVLYDADIQPQVMQYIYGLGGRNPSPELLEEAFNELLKVKKGKKKPFRKKYLGVRR